MDNQELLTKTLELSVARSAIYLTEPQYVQAYKAGYLESVVTRLMNIPEVRAEIEACYRHIGGEI